MALRRRSPPIERPPGPAAHRVSADTRVRIRRDPAGALEVSFLPAALSWLPIGWADYWVVDLDPDYRWAVVGGPSRGAMWVLARDRSLPPDILEGIKQRAKARGYVLDELILSPPQRDAMAATENASAADSTAGR